MEPLDLLTWRRKRNMTQTELAAKLGKTQETVSRWERGAIPLPSTLVAQLADIVVGVAAPAPVFLTGHNAHLRPDLKLYVKSHKAGEYHRDVEHPKRLLPAYPSDAKVPMDFLDNEYYTTALAAYRIRAAAEARRSAARVSSPLAIPKDWDDE